MLHVCVLTGNVNFSSEEHKLVYLQFDHLEKGFASFSDLGYYLIYLIFCEFTS